MSFLNKLKKKTTGSAYFATNEQVTERLDTCAQCPAYNQGICDECGCILRLKARLIEAKCPKGQWA